MVKVVEVDPSADSESEAEAYSRGLTGWSSPSDHQDLLDLDHHRLDCPDLLRGAAADTAASGRPSTDTAASGRPSTGRTAAAAGSDSDSEEGHQDHLPSGPDRDVPDLDSDSAASDSDCSETDSAASLPPPKPRSESDFPEAN